MKKIARLIAFISILTLTSLPAGAAERPKRVKSPATPVPVAAPVPSQTTAPAPSVLSIIPAQGEPGSKVMIFGSGFGTQATAFLGSVEIPVRLTEGRQLEFTIPAQLDAGLYALYLKRADGVVSRPYNFTVQALRPVLQSLSPDTVSACAQGDERDVTARGHNFLESSQLVFDGAVMKSRYQSPEAMVFSVPQVSGGLHQVVVRNSPDNSTVALGLMIETRPEISQVMIASEYVNYYELVIMGRNFHPNSSVYVDGVRIGGQGGADLAEREKLIYADCTKLIYQRHPYSRVNKDFQVMVMNPGGEASQAITVTAP